MWSEWRLVSTVNAEVDVQSIGLARAKLGAWTWGKPPSRGRKKDTHGFSLMRGFTVVREASRKRGDILNRIRISLVCRQGLLEGSSSPRI